MPKEKPDKDPLEKARELGLITAPPTTLEHGWAQLDESIGLCVKSVKQMRKAVTFLRKYMDHPFHIEAFDNIDGLIDEALIPYLADIDKEFQEIAPT